MGIALEFGMSAFVIIIACYLLYRLRIQKAKLRVHLPRNRRTKED